MRLPWSSSRRFAARRLRDRSRRRRQPAAAADAGRRRAPPLRGELIGLTAGRAGRSGSARPALQVREGHSLKLQFRGRRCILDAYLYPPAERPGAERVTHVDARLPSGVDIDQRRCVAALLDGA